MKKFFKNMFTEKKAVVAAASAVVVLAGVAVAVAVCGKNNSGNNVEPVTSVKTQTETQTKAQTKDIVAVTLKTKEGNDVTVEGVAVTDASGSTTITVTDNEGNVVIITATLETGADGKKTVKNAVLASGAKLVKADGTVIDLADAVVKNIEDNNNGNVATEVALSDAARTEVETEKEEEKTQQADSTSDSGNSGNGDSSDSGKTSGNSDSTSSSQESKDKPAAEEKEEKTEASTESRTEAETEAETEAATESTEAETKRPSGVLEELTAEQLAKYGKGNPFHVQELKAAMDQRFEVNVGGHTGSCYECATFEQDGKTYLEEAYIEYDFRYLIEGVADSDNGSLETALNYFYGDGTFRVRDYDYICARYIYDADSDMTTLYISTFGIEVSEQ